MSASARNPHRAGRVAGAPISWGVCEVEGWGVQLPADRVLGEMAALGLRATEAGPPGFLPGDAHELRTLLAGHGLRLVAGFVALVLHDPAAAETATAEAEQAAAVLGDAGAEVLVSAAATRLGGYERRPVLDAAGREHLAAMLARVGEIATAHGLAHAFHPHLGTLVEQPHEIERLLATCDVDLCLDTGHVFAAGGDPALLAARFARRVRHVHLKDVDGDVARRLRGRQLGYAEAVRAGLYRPLGTGDAPVARTIAELERAGYDGWYVIEQDTVIVAPGATAGPARDAAESVAFLAAVLTEPGVAAGPALPPEVLTVGRVGVDLYPEQPGVPLAEVRSFARSLGGTATNVAVAAARLGRRAAVVTKVGADPFGDYVRAALTAFGVDARHLGTDPSLRTPIVFCALDPPADPPLLFYREPKAPDLQLGPDDLDLHAVGGAGVFWVTGTGLSEEPARTTTMAALRARARAPHTVLDLDYRPMFWPSVAAAHEALAAALPLVTVAVGNRAEVDVAVGTRDPHEAARRLLGGGAMLAVVKLGSEGVLLAAAGEEVTVPPLPVEVVCGLGAGDAFGGALAHGLLAGWPLERVGRFANAAGAIVAGRLACADAMPDAAEVEAALAAGRVLP